MRAVIETVFDIFYLVTVLTVGIRMIRGSKAGTQFRLFGLMAVVLGAGDSFHLVPRALALCSAKQNNDKAFRWMWLTIVLSFGFYIPVVLWADVNPMIGMLMIPKTCAYVWTVLIGYNAMKAEAGKQN